MLTYTIRTLRFHSRLKACQRAQSIASILNIRPYGYGDV